MNQVNVNYLHKGRVFKCKIDVPDPVIAHTLQTLGMEIIYVDGGWLKAESFKHSSIDYYSYYNPKISIQKHLRLLSEKLNKCVGINYTAKHKPF